MNKIYVVLVLICLTSCNKLDKTDEEYNYSKSHVTIIDSNIHNTIYVVKDDLGCEYIIAQASEAISIIPRNDSSNHQYCENVK